MKKTLILGGHGFLGKNLAQLFPPDTVTLASRRTGLDLFDLAGTKHYLQTVQPDTIFHCAAHSGSLHYVTSFCGSVLKDNIQMAIHLYEAVKEVCPSAEIINPLSNCSYPGEAAIQYEADWLNGPVHPSVSAYANAKRFLYVLSESYKNQYGIITKNLLVPNAFGPGDSENPNKVHALNGIIIRMIQAMERGDKTFEIWGSGNPIREWGYAKDLARILFLCKDLHADITYPVNIAQNRGFRIKESAQMIGELLGYKGELVYNTKYQDGAAMKILNNERFRVLFPEVEFTDHRQALAETIAYYRTILPKTLPPSP